MSVGTPENDDNRKYTVVLNHEEQYSIWPERREIPNGWRSAGVSGTKAECLSHIDQVWTDMRPLSLRKAMEQANAVPRPRPPQAESPAEESLPVRLSRQPQPVELTLRPEKTIEGLLRQVKTGAVHVRFTATRGGTELTVPLEPEIASRIEKDAMRPEGTVQIVGNLVLDYTPVRCIADIDLSTLAGTGKLELLSARET